MRASEFVAAAKKALDVKTVYAFGQIGTPIDSALEMLRAPWNNMQAVAKGESTRSYAARYRNARATAKNVISGTFGFDCSGLIQGALCGWSADPSHYLGGADPSQLPTRYSADNFAHSTGWTSGGATAADWLNIKPGDIMWQSCDGKTAYHIAIYIGDGEAIEAAYDWCGAIYNMTDGIQKIQLAGFENGYMRTNRNGCAGYRTWLNFGTLPQIEKDPEPEQDGEITIWNNEDTAPDEEIISIDRLNELLEKEKVADALKVIADYLKT